MKKLFLSILLVAGALAMAPGARAQIYGVGAHFGASVDETGDLFLGGQARFGMNVLPLVIQPGVEFGIGDFSYTRAEVNGLLSIGSTVTRAFTPYAGAGVALSFNNDDSELGVNLMGGVVFKSVLPGLRPYVQARYTVQPGTDGVGLMGGLLLQLGAP